MRRNIIKIQANQNEIDLYCFLGEALIKTQIVEQALSHSITLKMHPLETKEQADQFLKQNQTYTLGHAIKIAIKEKLYNVSLQDELNSFLQQRNWLVHKIICGNEEDLNSGIIKEELFHKIKSISDNAESIQRLIEYDSINFCSSKREKYVKNCCIIKITRTRNKNTKVMSKNFTNKGFVSGDYSTQSEPLIPRQSEPIDYRNGTTPPMIRPKPGSNLFLPYIIAKEI